VAEDELPAPEEGEAAVDEAPPAEAESTPEDEAVQKERASRLGRKLRRKAQNKDQSPAES
jgi:hypothetical protein